MKSKKALLALVFLVFMGARASATQSQNVTVRDLLSRPEAFSQDQAIELQCYFLRESGAWLHLVKDSSNYIGLFVYDKKPSFVIPESETFPYVFVPHSLQDQIRTLRKGDPVIISGKCFEHQAVGKQAIGILVDQILVSEGGRLTAVPSSAESQKWAPGKLNPPARGLPAAGGSETYTIQIGGNTLSGLRWGEKYTLNEVEFVVTQDEKGDS